MKTSCPGSSIFIAVPVLFLLVSPGPVDAQQKTKEYKADFVQVLRDSATMHFLADYWITEVLGVVGEEAIPETIKLGDAITIEDSILIVKHIFVTECLVDLKWDSEVLCEEGQVQCLLVERLEDVPSDKGTHRLWITVARLPSFRTGSEKRQRGQIA